MRKTGLILALFLIISILGLESWAAGLCTEVFTPTKTVVLLKVGNAEVPGRLHKRTSAERLFLEQQKLIDQASPSDLVPIEWIVSPFYHPLFHTSLRIGKSLFEFTTEGWKIHPNGSADSARAFLYNNPFFKTQYEKHLQRFERGELPTYSIGLTLNVEKQVVENFIRLVDERKSTDRFDLYKHNCNQCLIKTLSDAGVSDIMSEIPSNWPVQFSTVLTFKNLLERINSNSELNLYLFRDPPKDPGIVFPWQFQTNKPLLKEVYRLAKYFIQWKAGFVEP